MTAHLTSLFVRAHAEACRLSACLCAPPHACQPGCPVCRSSRPAMLCRILCAECGESAARAGRCVGCGGEHYVVRRVA